MTPIPLQSAVGWIQPHQNWWWKPIEDTTIKETPKLQTQPRTVDANHIVIYNIFIDTQLEYLRYMYIHIYRNKISNQVTSPFLVHPRSSVRKRSRQSRQATYSECNARVEVKRDELPVSAMEGHMAAGYFASHL